MIGSVQDIVRDAQVALQDDGTRWPAPDLVRYLADGIELLLQAKPQEGAVGVVFEPAAGARQALPDDAISLLDVANNAQGRMRAMTQVGRADLEAVSRDWLSERPTTDLVHWMAPANEPKHFYVYPPASIGARLVLTYCQRPAPMPEPVGADWTSVSGTTGLDAKWSPALRDYVLYRAWLKDAEFGGNAQIAAGYLSTFTAQLGAA